MQAVIATLLRLFEGALGARTSREDVVDGTEEIVATHIAWNAADFLVVFKDHKGRDDANGLCQTDLGQSGIVEVHEADRDPLGLFGGLVGGQELPAEYIAVNATWDFQDDHLEVWSWLC